MTAPNILFILIDDLGCLDLTCFCSTFYETPNLDYEAKLRRPTGPNNARE